MCFCSAGIGRFFLKFLRLPSDLAGGLRISRVLRGFCGLRLPKIVLSKPKKRCLELSQPNKRWNLKRPKVPDTFFWALSLDTVQMTLPAQEELLAHHHRRSI